VCPGSIRLDELAAGIPGLSGGDATPVSHLTADSRAARPGSLFAARPGQRADGARFIADAVARGAVAVLAPPGVALPPGLPALRAEDARRALALLAARLHPGQPGCVVAVTGTNGKTSTAEFFRQLAGPRAASLGTLGLVAEGFAPGPSLTTPDPVTLHGTLAELAAAGVTHLAMEASSHGLEQRRLDGVRLAAAGFSNLSRDHLDYHKTLDAYRTAKLRLFDTLLPEGAAAVVNADMDNDTLAALRDIAGQRGLRLTEVGESGGDLRLLSARPLPAGQALVLEVHGRRHELKLPLPGRFQADNALLAAGLALAVGIEDAVARLGTLRGVRGRMELAAEVAGAAIYVDYAHTPDALNRLLAALRPHVAPGAKLHVLFGAGGDRDPGKRPLMGAAAAAADVAWITDDNPRSEDPAAIRRAVLAACPGGRDAGPREGAIAAALDALRPGDVLAVAGKGHETGQTVAGVTTPFDDAEVVRRLAGVPA
jgi:UDP-N-acetylmuramoyl-L-alanyl-D-glutamate--2,6-diaminopimelate ligase